ncbi:MAG: HD domain-containing protein [Thermoleophilia bacterium]|nr:HD domain-containing protein [Thermoleophilia bacterium]
MGNRSIGIERRDKREHHPGFAMNWLKDPPSRSSTRWEGRPFAAAAVRALVALGPFSLSIVAVWLVAERLVPGEASLATVVLWWIGLSAVASGLLLAVDRQARRLIPLAAMLDLSLVFPDEAPSRMRTAMLTLNAEALERELREARVEGESATPAEAAERVLRLVAALRRHDWKTRGHSERVRAYSQMIANEMGLSHRDRDRLNWAALIHDVGKLAVPAEVLNKTGKLTDHEFELIRRHAEEGARLVEPLRMWLGEWCEAVADHHEKWDGTGYPRGLAGTDISLGGRIVAVADAFDVMTSSRSYKTAQSVAKARRELVSCSGTHFDPSVVRALLSVSIGRMRFAVGPLAWLTYLPVVARVPLTSVAGAGAGSGAGIASVGVAAATLAALPVAPVQALATPLVQFGGNERTVVAAPTGPRPEALEDAVRKLGVTVFAPAKDPAGGGGGPAAEDPSGAETPESQDGSSPSTNPSSEPDPGEDSAQAPAADPGPTENPPENEAGGTPTNSPGDPGSGYGHGNGAGNGNGRGRGAESTGTDRSEVAKGNAGAGTGSENRPTPDGSSEHRGPSAEKPVRENAGQGSGGTAQQPDAGNRGAPGTGPPHETPSSGGSGAVGSENPGNGKGKDGDNAVGKVATEEPTR